MPAGPPPATQQRVVKVSVVLGPPLFMPNVLAPGRERARAPRVTYPSECLEANVRAFPPSATQQFAFRLHLLAENFLAEHFRRDGSAGQNRNLATGTLALALTAPTKANGSANDIAEPFISLLAGLGDSNAQSAWAVFPALSNMNVHVVAKGDQHVHHALGRETFQPAA